MLVEYIQRILLTAPPVLLSLTVHEAAHAWAASRMGDHTARMLGRVSLNPIRHLDVLGTLMLFFSGLFGWAKPVPVNPRNLRNPAKAMMLVAVAGPLSNLMLAGAFALVQKLLPVALPLITNSPGVYMPIAIMIELGVLINISLAVFNLIPIPPLDGSKALSYLLPPQKAYAFSRVEPYGFIILLVLITTGVVNRIVSPLVFLLAGLLTGGA
ncbi:MAG: site-2 protease family protein [Deltaproteobacteria bacterium]|nr:site-2 protease family protein [Deltaproteobacteria bacterium]